MDIASVLGDTLKSVLEAILNATLFKLFYYAEKGLCWIIQQLYAMFMVFSGQAEVFYGEKREAMSLFGVFFQYTAPDGTAPVLTNIYNAMALTGIAMTFGFAIWSVTKKMFDAEGKVQTSIGQILGAVYKSILLILSLGLVMHWVIKASDAFMEVVQKTFDYSFYLNMKEDKQFTDEEYAAMARVLMTIGNYSLSPNGDNRYNMNLCYNAIRSDMLYLQDHHVFAYNYYKTENGQVVQSWQSVLQRIAKSHDLTRDVKVDVYNDSISRSIGAAMEYLRTNPDPLPVEKTLLKLNVKSAAPLDRIVFLLGTFRAAKNKKFNENPGFQDALRGPYYYNEGRSIYDLDDVDEDFDIGFGTDYIVVFMAGVAIIMDLIVILLNCVARMFNMIFLYIIAPPVIAAMPLDGGGKFKQWSIAFLVQSFSVFGTIIAMRLLIIYLIIVSGPTLVLFPNDALLDVLAKFFLIYGGIEASKKATGLLTGILADSAGWQSIQAGDMSSSAGKLAGSVTGMAKSGAGLALKATGKVANFATKPLQNLAGRAWSNTGGKVGKAWGDLGKGDVKGKEAMESAQKRLREEKAYAKLTGGGGDSKDDKKDGSQTPASQSKPDAAGKSDGPAKKTGMDAFKGPEPSKNPPPLPPKAAESGDANSSKMAKFRQGAGFASSGGMGAAGAGDTKKRSRDDSGLRTSGGHSSQPAAQRGAANNTGAAPNTGGAPNNTGGAPNTGNNATGGRMKPGGTGPLPNLNRGGGDAPDLKMPGAGPANNRQAAPQGGAPGAIPNQQRGGAGTEANPPAAPGMGAEPNKAPPPLGQLGKQGDGKLPDANRPK